MRLRSLLAIAGLVTLSACGGGKTVVVNEPADLQPIKHQTLKIEKVWHGDNGAGSGPYLTGFQLAVDGRHVYTADRNGTVTALNLKDGSRVWRVKTGLRAVSGPTVDEGVLLIGTRDGQVVALSTEDGKEKWRAKVSSEVLAAPAAGNGRVVVRMLDGRIVAFDIATGTRRWTADNGVPTLTLRGASSPVIDGDAVYVGLDNGKVVAYDLDSGEKRWEQLIAAPSGRSELERVVDIDAALLLVQDQLYAVSMGGQLASLSRRSGRVRWKQPVTSRTGISFNRDQVFTTDVDGTVWSVGRASGARQWQQKDLAYRQLSPPVMFGGYVVVGDYDGYLHWLIPEDGTIVARAHPLGDAIRAAPVVVGNLLLVLSTKGDIVALRVKYPKDDKK